MVGLLDHTFDFLEDRAFRLGEVLQADDIEAVASQGNSELFATLAELTRVRRDKDAAVPAIIKNLRSRGYKLVTMTKLLGGHYKFREVKGRRLPARHPLPEPRDFPVRIEGP